MSRAALDWALTVQSRLDDEGVPQLTPSQLLVLLAYARVAQADGGEARLKTATLATATGLSTSAVRAATGELRRRRLLLRDGETVRGVPVYRLPVSDDAEQLALSLFSPCGKPADNLRKTCEKAAPNLRIVKS